jgi:hypothetical protein
MPLTMPLRVSSRFCSLRMLGRVAINIELEHQAVLVVAEPLDVREDQDRDPFRSFQDSFWKTNFSSSAWSARMAGSRLGT